MGNRIFPVFKFGNMSKENNKTDDQITQEYTFKGCLNGALIFLTVAMLLGNFIFMGKAGTDQEIMISMAVFPGIGLFLVSPNIIIHTVRKSRNWNRTNFGYMGFTRVEAPDDYRMKLLWPVIREQLLNMSAVFGPLFVGLIFATIGIESSLSRIADRAGLFFLGLLIFGGPVLVYYMTCAIIRLRVLMRKEYEVYHGVVVGASFRELRLNSTRHKTYGVVLGMRTKDVDHTPATIVFIPDEIYVIPDNEE